MRATTGSLKLAHHIGIIRVLLNNPAAVNTPRIRAGIINRPFRFIPSQIIVQCNSRLTVEQGIKTTDNLFDRPLPTLG